MKILEFCKCYIQNLSTARERTNTIRFFSTLLLRNIYTENPHTKQRTAQRAQSSIINKLFQDCVFLNEERTYKQKRKRWKLGFSTLIFNVFSFKSG